MIICRWNNFHGNLSSYKKKLKAALEVHSLIRDLEEVRERASEKVMLSLKFPYLYPPISLNITYHVKLNCYLTF